MKTILLVLLLVGSSGCTSAVVPGANAGTVAEALRAAGLTVRDAGLVEQPFFGVPARVFVAEEEDVQVYEFATAAEAEHAAGLVEPAGGTVGASSIAWMAPPHWFRKDRLVVNYLGSSEKTLAALRRLLGPQFAGQ